MLKQILAFGFAIVATGAQANDWEAASTEYDESYGNPPIFNGVQP
jgi:hypothetical protein